MDGARGRFARRHPLQRVWTCADTPDGHLDTVDGAWEHGAARGGRVVDLALVPCPNFGVLDHVPRAHNPASHLARLEHYDADAVRREVQSGSCEDATNAVLRERSGRGHRPSGTQAAVRRYPASPAPATPAPTTTTSASDGGSELLQMVAPAIEPCCGKKKVDKAEQRSKGVRTKSGVSGLR